MHSLVRVICRDVASAIKELLNTVNTVLRKYQHQNRRVSGYISKFKRKKKSACAHKHSCCEISGAERLSVFIG